MNTIRNLQIVCFFSGLIGGYSYGHQEYALVAISGMTAAIALGLIYSIITKP